MDNALIIFLKNFKKGNVKTRLAESVGEDEALNIYKTLVYITFSEVAKLKCQVYVYFSEYIDRDFVDETETEWGHLGFEYKIQTGKNLGERMHNALMDALYLYENVMLIGTDCPYFKTREIQRGFNLLRYKDVVLGPTNDGGYYAIGMKKGHNFFSNIKWSTETVLQDTIAKIIQKGLEVRMLHIYDDIDYEEDWVNYQKFREYLESHS